MLDRSESEGIQRTLRGLNGNTSIIGCVGDTLFVDVINIFNARGVISDALLESEYQGCIAINVQMHHKLHCDCCLNISSSESYYEVSAKLKKWLEINQ